MRLVILYSLFAAFATSANLATQAGVHALLPFEAGKPGLVYWLALCAGTGAGLILKYLLDKRWIFDDRTGSVAAHTRKFSLYTLMGLATTAIFWGVQTGFVLIWQSQAMLYLGGAVGLAIGYVLKYQLDKRFVFVTRTTVA